MIPTHRVSALAIALLALPCGAQTSQPSPSSPQPQREHAAAAPAPASRPDDAALPVLFHGRLPGCVDPTVTGVFHVEFRIYRSPQGGAPVWREARDVQVTHGTMRVELGAVTPIPFAIHTTPFKWLGAAVNGNREVYPRFPIVNVVYVSPAEAATPATGGSGKGDAQEPRLPERAETARTWAAALEHARAQGGDLPSYEQWYADLALCSPHSAAERSGHYEWVLPWVYDTASHGDYNRYFRGRFQGCDYMDLSPEKDYVYRVAPRAAEARGEPR